MPTEDGRVDLVVRNAKVSTLQVDGDEAEAFAVRGEQFVAVGDETDVMPLAGEGTRVLDAGGRRVVPGLNDSHIHTIRCGLQFNLELRWDGVASFQRGLEMISERNFARDSFPINGEDPLLSQWPVTVLGPDTVEAAIVSDLRGATGRFPNSRRLADLIQVLTTGNERFAELWVSGVVSAHREARKAIEHPSVGPITVDCDVMTDGDAELKIVILTATPDTQDETKLRLAFLSDVPDTRSWLRQATHP